MRARSCLLWYKCLVPSGLICLAWHKRANHTLCLVKQQPAAVRNNMQAYICTLSWQGWEVGVCGVVLLIKLTGFSFSFEVKVLAGILFWVIQTIWCTIFQADMVYYRQYMGNWIQKEIFCSMRTVVGMAWDKKRAPTWLASAAKHQHLLLQISMYME
jgi:hypothetical protein